MIITIILVILIFGLLVFVHEFGHFITARRGGIEVEEFGFGFPPRLLGIKRGGTLYSLNWIPLGGFVKMRGEDGGDVSPGSFGGAGFGRKMAVLLAGVGMNLLVAYGLLVYLAFTGLPGSLQRDLGLPTPQSETPKRMLAISVSEGSPAAAAGIRRGDVIVGADGGRTFATEKELIDFNKEHAGETVVYSLERGGEVNTKEVSLRSAEEGAKTGYMGITPLQLYEVRYGWNSPLVAVQATVKTVWLTVAGFADSVARMIVDQRVSEGVAGPVGIVALLGGVMHLGLNYVLFFVATISVSLAVLNALPIPALDGGRAALLGIGKLLGRPVPPKIEGVIHTAGFVLLLLSMLVITVRDIKTLL